MPRTVHDEVRFWRHAETGLDVLKARFHGHAYDRHAHDSYAIGVTLSGHQRFHHRGRRHVSTTGTVIALNPDDAHDGSAADDGGFAYWMIYPDEALWSAVMADAAECPATAPFFAGTLIRDAECAAGLVRLCRTLAAGADGIEAEGAIADTLVTLARRHGGGAPPAGPRADEPALRRVRDRLHDGYHTHLRLDDLAREAGRSRFWVTRAFASAYGLPPHAYLTRRRLEAARRLLAEGEPAAEVATAVGFVDQSHLIRRFKASYGITPGEFQAACTDVQSLS